MQTKRHTLSSPKVIKNYFLLYYADDSTKVLQEIYKKASLMLESFKGFYISSDILEQHQQLLYLALTKHSIEFKRFEGKRLLKNELIDLLNTLSGFFGVIDYATLPKIHKSSIEQDIKEIAKEVNVIFIESYIIESLEDLILLETIKQLAQALCVRIEIGIDCHKKWLPNLRTLTTNMCVLS